MAPDFEIGGVAFAVASSAAAARIRGAVGACRGDLVRLPDRSPEFFGLLVDLCSLEVDRAPAGGTEAAGDGIGGFVRIALRHQEAIAAQPGADCEVSLSSGDGGRRLPCPRLQEGLGSGPAEFETQVPDLSACLEVAVAYVVDGPFSASSTAACVDCLSRRFLDGADGEWMPLECREIRQRRGANRQRFQLAGASVPLFTHEAPAAWADGGERQALYWREADFYGVYEMEVAMARVVLKKLLKTYLATSGAPKGAKVAPKLQTTRPMLKAWPSRDRHQLWAALWVALQFVPGRTYSQGEAAWLVMAQLSEPDEAVADAVLAELRSRGFLADHLCGAVSVLEAGVRWVLDGDKLFRAQRRAATTGGDAQGEGSTKSAAGATAASHSRPWWSLPLATQHLALASDDMRGTSATLEAVSGSVPSPKDAQTASSAGGGEELGSGQEAQLEAESRNAELRSLLNTAMRADEDLASERAGCWGYRCVLLEPQEGDDSYQYSAGNTTVTFVSPSGTQVDGRATVMAVAEGEHSFTSFEVRFVEPTVCTEVLLVNSGDGRAERVPPFRLDMVLDGASGPWCPAKCQAMPALEEANWRGATRCFVPGAVPIHDFQVPAAWIEDADKAAALAHEVSTCHSGAVALRMAAGRAAAAAWLETNTGSRSGQGSLLLGSPPRLRQWPGKDLQQAWAALWMVLHLVPGRRYREAEIDWVIATRFVPSQVPDCPTLRKELERRGLVQRSSGGGGFVVCDAGVRRALSGVHVAKGPM